MRQFLKSGSARGCGVIRIPTATAHFAGFPSAVGKSAFGLFHGLACRQFQVEDRTAALVVEANLITICYDRHNRAHGLKRPRAG
jgi:hypothetical protein